MISIDDRYMNFISGWICEYKDGTQIYEGDLPWKKVVKKEIKALYLKWHDRMWTIRGKENYIQFNRGFVTFSASGDIRDETRLLERCIGYYDEKGRKVIYKVNNNTGKMTIEVREG